MYEVYHAQPGEDLIMIANKFRTSVEEIIRANGLEELYEIVPGQEIVVPISPSLAFTLYEVMPNDTLYSIAQAKNTTPEIITAINGLEENSYLYPGQFLLVPQEGVSIYITKMGDDIKSVLDEIGLSLEDILVYNQKVYLLPEQLIAYSNRSADDI